MTEISRRAFNKKSLLLSCLATLAPARPAMAMFDKVQKDAFLARDDLSDALRSLYMTYDSTYPYDHKFNEALVKDQLRNLEFSVKKGINEDQVDHYIMTNEPVLKRIKALVEQEGAERALVELFDDEPCSYQLFEHITVREGERSFPCPYKSNLENGKKWLKTFTIEWSDVCNKWCIPIWKRSAEIIGMEVDVKTGLTCSVRLQAPEEKPKS
jgi:hypothetical protein